MTQFNFGPVARTSAGGEDDTINLASFPLHVMLNALVGSTSIEEFIAWLWHDLIQTCFSIGVLVIVRVIQVGTMFQGWVPFKKAEQIVRTTPEHP